MMTPSVGVTREVRLIPTARSCLRVLRFTPACPTITVLTAQFRSIMLGWWLKTWCFKRTCTSLPTPTARNRPSGLNLATATAPLKEKWCSSALRRLLTSSARPSSSMLSSRAPSGLMHSVRICVCGGAGRGVWGGRYVCVCVCVCMRRSARAASKLLADAQAGGPSQSMRDTGVCMRVRGAHAPSM